MSKVTVRQGLISVAVFPFQPYMGEGEESLEGCSSNLQAFLSNTQLHLTTEARSSLIAETVLLLLVSEGGKACMWVRKINLKE